ncbi:MULTISPECIES: hypothetical protein [Francisella]|uniref:Uncharacterized protein n=1 Tax=Francisella marina TaxID=2249302 RepID=A0ABX5ZF99_9GAMM|nr:MULTISPECIES: hypothetical protein [Francisella]QEO56684.1 hypothetical protein F0R74_02065 [Francisella marina]QEO59195.1 hypothetical protein F0R75_05160 [Francisella marina]
MIKLIFVFVRVAILIFLFCFCYSFNDTRDLLYLQTYFDTQNVEKVNVYHRGSRMSEYSTNRKVDYYR